MVVPSFKSKVSNFGTMVSKLDTKNMYNIDMENKDALTHQTKTFSIICTLLDVINSNEESDTSVILAKYLLDHIYEIQDKSVYDIANETYISRSSVQRFFKNIGFDSYNNIKFNMPESLIHNKRFANFYRQEDFAKKYKDDLQMMIEDIDNFSNSEQLDHLVDLIYVSKTVVFNYFENSTNAAHEFQEAMVNMGKSIRLVTNSSLTSELLSSLTEEDTFITLSMTGNYAIATLNEVSKVKANKILISLNDSQVLKDTYDKIINFSKNNMTNDYIQSGLKNAYTIYGFTYLMDLVANRYFMKYKN